MGAAEAIHLSVALYLLRDLACVGKPKKFFQV